MFFSFFKKEKFVPISHVGIIDSQFPQEHPMGFRNFEINGILERISDSCTYTMYYMKPGKKAWFSNGYGINSEVFIRNLKGYSLYYPNNTQKIYYLPKKIIYPFLAYTYFLAETYTLLPYLEKNKLPFIFVLYPGGGFGLNNHSSDQMLREIFGSKYFRKVIVTQPVTRKYLLENNFCSEKQIHYEFGGYVQFLPEDIPTKLQYKKDKSTIDICFVAAKYSQYGEDKGYDIFINVAKKLAYQYSFVRFHVVGGFNASDIDVTDIKDKISFYGYQGKTFLTNFYPRMDICLSPNRPFKLFDGNFDGFPLGLDAMCFANVLMTTDELDNKELFEDNKDIVIIKPNSEDILQKITKLIENPIKLLEIGMAGQRVLFSKMNPNTRLLNIVDLLTKEIIKYNR